MPPKSNPRNTTDIHRQLRTPAASSATLPVDCRNWPARCRLPNSASVQSSPTRKQSQHRTQGDRHVRTDPNHPYHPAIHLHGVVRADRDRQPLDRRGHGRKRCARRLPDHDHTDSVVRPARTPLPALSFCDSAGLFFRNNFSSLTQLLRTGDGHVGRLPVAAARITLSVDRHVDCDSNGERHAR